MLTVNQATDLCIGRMADRTARCHWRATTPGSADNHTVLRSKSQRRRSQPRGRPRQGECMCTRVLWNENKFGVIAGRTMDWPESTEPLLTATPRGHRRHGGKLAGQTVITANPLEWTSRYGSVATSVYGIGTVDGLNEQGFAGPALYL